MARLESKIDVNGDAFRQQRADMLACVGELRAIEEKVRETELAARDKFHARGPVGIEGLTSLKWIVLGDGEIRS